ncbi:MAG: class I SAM-dependent rRNA methyltransferase [Vagococcus fluvialis]
MNQVIIKNKAKKKFNQRYPLIHQEDLVDKTANHSSSWIKFVSEDKHFLGYGYLGVQNKGYGWMISFDENKPVNKEVMTDLFKQAFNSRKSFFRSQDTTAFRIFNGEGDGFGGLTIDWYDTYIVISWYNETIYGLKESIKEVILECLPEVVGVYEKVRFKKDDLPESEFTWGKEAPEPLIVIENNVSYATYLNEGLMTGIFLDQKEVRGALSEGLANGKSLLNMFSYTGAFSVAATFGGSVETTSVDLAKRSLEKTQEQFLVNGMDLDSQRIIVMDVFNYFKYAKKKELTYDVIVLDPPSFARNKKKTFSVAKDYSKLTEEAVELIEPNGLLIASTNAANVSFDRFVQMVEKGITNGNRRGKQVNTYRLPSDFKVSKHFPEGNYLKVLIYEIV